MTMLLQLPNASYDMTMLINYISPKNGRHPKYWHFSQLFQAFTRGWAMSLPMSQNNLRWMSVDEYDSVIACDPYGPTGYVLEVDLYYPSSLHAVHNDFPLASHHLDVDYSMLSSYAQSLAPHTHKIRKLCQTFLPKIKYTLHLRTSNNIYP